jgi:hypothetical protein
MCASPSVRAVFAVFFVAAMAAGTLMAQEANPACDRACLNGFIDRYLAALEARDPSRLPLTENARYTENCVTLKLGDGLWGPSSRWAPISAGWSIP